MRILLSAAVLTLALGPAVSPALAQGTVEELVVTGHKAHAADTLNYAVGYADLDLRTQPGRTELYKRVSNTADYVCWKLGEKAGPSAPCRTTAIANARPQVSKAIERAKLSKAAWKPGPAWTPPKWTKR